MSATGSPASNMEQAKALLHVARQRLVSAQSKLERSATRLRLDADPRAATADDLATDVAAILAKVAVFQNSIGA